MIARDANLKTMGPTPLFFRIGNSLALSNSKLNLAQHFNRKEFWSIVVSIKTPQLIETTNDQLGHSKSAANLTRISWLFGVVSI
jgi:hypothetical protein